MHFLASLFLGAALTLASTPTIGANCAGFNDLEDSSPFCSSVGWLKNQGITLGCTATEYCPSSPVTRLQMAAFLRRLAAVTSPALYGANGELFGHYVYGVAPHHTAGERGAPYATLYTQGRTYYVLLFTKPGAGDVAFSPVAALLYYELAGCSAVGQVWMQFQSGPPSAPLSLSWAAFGYIDTTGFSLYGASAKVTADVNPMSYRGYDGVCQPTAVILPAASTFIMTELGPTPVTFPLVLR